MQSSITTRSFILIFAITMMGCSINPKDLSAYEVCDVGPDKWREIAVPSEREALLDLLEKTSENRVRNLFRSVDDLREAWFESSSGDELLVCRYDPQKSCYSGGELRKAFFSKLDSSWEVGSTTMTICSH